MSCENCNKAQGQKGPAYYRWKNASVEINACDDHLAEVIDALSAAQTSPGSIEVPLLLGHDFGKVIGRVRGGGQKLTIDFSDRQAQDLFMSAKAGLGAGASTIELFEVSVCAIEPEMENEAKEILKKKIIAWIFAKHDHHGSDGNDDPVCNDGDSPYVNSLELEGFIKSL